MPGAPPTHRAARPPAARRLAAAALLGALAGCDSPGSSRTPLFPLEAGREWTYTVTTRWDDDNVDTETRTLRALGEDGSAGEPAWRRRDTAGIDYWLRHDASGIWRVAAKSDADPQPVADPASASLRRYVLKSPTTVGTQWNASTTLYLFKRRAEFPPELKYKHPNVPMSYVIAAVDEKVATPAGGFEHCVKVHGQATVRVYADSVGGWKDLPVDTFEWYCPEVGLVRLERHERANSAFLLGGTLSMELTRWR